MTASAALPLRATDWVDSVALPRFDVSLGELRSVDLRVEAHLEGTAAVENLNDSPASLSTPLAALVTLARPAPVGAVTQLLQAVGEKTTIPVLLVLIVIGFVAVQNRIDRRDPKLAQAPLRHEPEYMEFR